MKNYNLFFVALLIASSCATSKNSYTNLFTSNSDGWKEVGEADWIFEDDVLIGSGEMGYVFTNTTHSDFVFEMEFMPDAKVNSGIFMRCPNQEASANDCYEINIWDDHPNQENRTGSIVTHGKPLVHIDTNNKWNTYKVQAKEDRIQVWVNNQLTADLTNDKSRQGFLGLQAANNGTIKFRNIKILKL